MWSDWYDEATLFCSACAFKVPAALAEIVDEEALTEDPLAFEGPIRFDCVVCVDEWLAATGHPPLKELLRTRRRPERGGD